MVRKAFDELFYYGPAVVYKHIKAAITKDDADYILAKQNKAAQFSMDKIEKVVSENFYYYKRVKPDLKNPRTFDEKIQWMMLYDATPLKTRLVDKYLVREFVKEKVGEEYLVPLIGVYDRFDDIDFSALPQQFALKLNNGNGMNIVVKDKSRLDVAEAKKKFDFWMKTNFAYSGFELQYRDVPQKIIAEKYIEQSDGNLYDYKMHCYDGKMGVCQLIGDRDLANHTARQAFLDPYYNRVNESEGFYPDYDVVPEKPDNWDEMVNIAENLAEGFSYVRIDLYSVEGKIYFGEYTFTPAVGHHPGFAPPSTDLKWGKRIRLPGKYVLDVPKRSE